MSNYKQKKGVLLDRGAFTIVGFLIAIVLFFIWQSISLKNHVNNIESKYSLNSGAKIDTVKVGDYTLRIKEHNEIEIRDQNQLIDEKLKSLEDRITDMYYSLGIIVTLIVFGLVSVYFRTESEVAKHMDENYKKYKEEIEIMNADAQKMVSEIKSKAELADQVFQNKQSTQELALQQPPDDNNG